MYIQAEHIYKNFGSYEAAKDITFGVEKGKMAALLGPSGSGKTTILRMIAGLETQDRGDIIIDGKVVNDIPARDRGIGFVFQSYALFRYMTVYENIAYGLKVKKVPNAKIKERVGELIRLTGLEGLDKRYPNQLSGGQRQRVAFARALAPDPQLLLLDEPFAAIDAKVRRELRSWLRETVAQVGITSIFVTHDQEEALEVADQIMIINEGKMEQDGSPIEIYKNPATPFVASFTGSTKTIDHFVGFKGFECLPKNAKVIVRPEHMEAFKADNVKYHELINASEDGVITAIDFRGSFLLLHLEVNGLSFIVNRSLERREVHVGEHMRVLFWSVYVFNEEESYVKPNSLLKDVEVEYL